MVMEDTSSLKRVPTDQQIAGPPSSSPSISNLVGARGGTKSINNLFRIKDKDPRKGSTQKIGGVEDRKAKLNEGEESLREPKTYGILKWDFSRRTDSEIYTVQFSSDDQYVACGAGDGNIYIYSCKSKNLEFNLKANMDQRVPVTSLCFKPVGNHKTKNILSASYADGTVRHWHFVTGQLLSTITEIDNQTNIISYRNDGRQFVTGGSDCLVRVYDFENQTPVLSLDSGRFDETAGHSNRIFSTKFHPVDPNIVVSGGWDNTLQIWDLRTGYAERSIFKPHICGDSLDIDDAGEKILTGSYAKEHQLQIWSWKTGEVVQTVPWGVGPNGEKSTCLLYSASYSKSKESPAGATANRFILAGGGGPSKEIRLFNTDNFRNAGSVFELNCAVYSTAISPSDKKVALGGSGKTLQVFDIDESPPDSSSRN